MMPIRDLRNRIRWDPPFGRGRFELAYRDRASRDLDGAVIWQRADPDLR